jgi:hypothetical protein
MLDRLLGMTPYTPPEPNKSAFNCPHCRAFANHIWFSAVGRHDESGSQISLDHWRISRCAHCGRITVWREGIMLYPDSSLAPPPSPDLPAEIASDFEEARSIVQRSPRGAAALFRLCIQKLLPANEPWVVLSPFLEKTPGFRQRGKTSRAAACEPQARAAVRRNIL